MSALRRVLFLGVFGGCAVACDGRLDVIERQADGEAGASAGGKASGGSTAIAGSGGAAGAVGGSGGGSSLPSPFVLDDFEDGDTVSSNIPEGPWYFTPDETCSGSRAVEATPERAESDFALRARGGGCTNWGALVGLDLATTNDVFDASSFDALQLWARAEPGSVTQISVSLLEPFHFDTVIELTPEWQEFVLPFDRFEYTDQGPAEPFDINALTHLQFFVFSADAFDFWLDDVAFVRVD